MPQKFFALLVLSLTAYAYCVYVDCGNNVASAQKDFQSSISQEFANLDSKIGSLETELKNKNDALAKQNKTIQKLLSLYSRNTVLLEKISNDAQKLKDMEAKILLMNSKRTEMLLKEAEMLSVISAVNASDEGTLK